MKWQNIRAKDLRVLIGKLDLHFGRRGRGPHEVYWYYLDGKKQFRVTLPNVHGGSGSLSTGFLKKVKNQLMLNNENFVDLVECPLTPEAYEEIVRSKT